MFAPVYLDHNATTPLNPAVREAMLPFLGARFGNASSRHEYGRQARHAIDTARQQVAVAVGAHPTEVLFTSGGSEANNLFIKGAATCLKPGLVAVSAIEHPCVREPARALARQGWRFVELVVDGQGRIAREDYARVLDGEPALVSVMLANNETGVLQDVAALAMEAKPRRAWFHTDAVQALGKLALDFRSLNRVGVHAMSLSAHKLGGPLGAGALVLDKRVELAPLIAGGGQERNLRSGTENVPAIVGFGLACELAVAGLGVAAERLTRQREEMQRALTVFGVQVFSQHAPRLPNTLFFAVPGMDGETLVGQLDRAGFAVASGSACSSTAPEPSHALLAMGVAPELARGAVRVSLGRESRDEDVAGFIACFGETLKRLKGLTAMAV